MSAILDVFLGIKVLHILAGFLGGLVRAMIAKTKTLWTVVTSSMVGGICAVFFTPVLLPIVAKNVTVAEGASLEPLTGFLVGLTAMSLCEYAIAKVAARTNPEQPKGSPNAGP